MFGIENANDDIGILAAPADIAVEGWLCRMSVSIQLLALTCLFCFPITSASDLPRCGFGIERQIVKPQQQAMRSTFIPPQVAPLRRSNASTHFIRASHAGAVPPFLRHRFLFRTDSSGLTAESLRVLTASGQWLGSHPAARVLIVGTCDASGSEVCTAALAQARGQAIRGILDVGGTHGGQIAAVRVWDNLDRQCRPTQTRCQRLDRSAWIFIASPIAR